MSDRYVSRASAIPFVLGCVLLLFSGCKSERLISTNTASSTTANPASQDSSEPSLPAPESTGADKSPAAEHKVLHGKVSQRRNKITKITTPAGSAAPPPTDEEQLEQAVGKLNKGNLAYNTPEKMKTGQTGHVVARIGSSAVPIATLEAGMPSGEGTTTVTAPTPVSAMMKMTLASADFDITPLSSEEQFIAGDSPTTWAWDITPKHSGKLTLHLAAVVELKGLSKDFTTVDKNIAVEVDPVDAVTKFAKENTVWILTTLGAGIAGVWAWLRKRKNPSSSDEEAS